MNVVMVLVLIKLVAGFQVVEKLLRIITRKIAHVLLDLILRLKLQIHMQIHVIGNIVWMLSVKRLRLGMSGLRIYVLRDHKEIY